MVQVRDADRAGDARGRRRGTYHACGTQLYYTIISHVHPHFLFYEVVSVIEFLTNTKAVADHEPTVMIAHIDIC